VGKRRRKRAGAGWRKRFLAALARTANVDLAAEKAGADRSTAYGLRKRDAGFAAAWLRARAWGRARVAAEGRPVHSGGRPRRARPGEDARELVVRSSKNAGTQIVRAGEGRWSPSVETAFFAAVAAGYGIRRSAREVGFSARAVYERRLRDPAFAARWEEAKQQGLARNDMLLIDSVQWTLDPEAVAAAEDLPRPTIAEAIQIVRLYRRDPEPGVGRGRRGYSPPQRTGEQAIESILGKIEAIERHQAPKKLAEGWTRDETGNWIPPGWVKASGGGPAGPAA
jgi:hypothetical protein